MKDSLCIAFKSGVLHRSVPKKKECMGNMQSRWKKLNPKKGKASKTPKASKTKKSKKKKKKEK